MASGQFGQLTGVGLWVAPELVTKPEASTNKTVLLD